MRRAIASSTVICATTLTVFLSGCAGTAPSDPPPAATSVPSLSPTASTPAHATVAIEVVPDSTSVQAGHDLPATVHLENLTGHPLPFNAGMCDGTVAIGIASDAIPFDPAFAAMGCAKMMLPAAGRTYRGVISTRYGGCIGAGGTSLDGKEIACNADGTMPALPAGRYRTAIAVIGSTSIAFVDPVTITLTR